MRGKRLRIILAVMWGVLALPTGYFALAMYGLSRMDSGTPVLNPQLIALFVLPLVLIISAIGLFLSSKTSETNPKNILAGIFAILPLLNILLILILVWQVM